MFKHATSLVCALTRASVHPVPVWVTPWQRVCQKRIRSIPSALVNVLSLLKCLFQLKISCSLYTDFLAGQLSPDFGNISLAPRESAPWRTSGRRVGFPFLPLQRGPLLCCLSWRALMTSCLRFVIILTATDVTSLCAPPSEKVALFLGDSRDCCGAGKKRPC